MLTLGPREKDENMMEEPAETLSGAILEQQEGIFPVCRIGGNPWKYFVDAMYSPEDGLSYRIQWTCNDNPSGDMTLRMTGNEGKDFWLELGRKLPSRITNLICVHYEKIKTSLTGRV